MNYKSVNNFNAVLFPQLMSASILKSSRNRKMDTQSAEKVLKVQPCNKRTPVWTGVSLLVTSLVFFFYSEILTGQNEVFGC